MARERKNGKMNHPKKKGRPITVVECIVVQSATVPEPNLSDEPWTSLQKELDDLPQAEGRICSRIDRPGEVMVMIRWEMEPFDPEGSRVARLLVSELKNHGLVNYSAWSEKVGKKAAIGKA